MQHHQLQDETNTAYSKGPTHRCCSSQNRGTCRCQLLLLRSSWAGCRCRKARSAFVSALSRRLAFRSFHYHNHTKWPASENPALGLTVKPQHLCSNPVHLSMAQRKKLTQPLPAPCHPSRCLQYQWCFHCFLGSPHLCSMKEPGIQAPVRWSF